MEETLKSLLDISYQKDVDLVFRVEMDKITQKYDQE